MEKQKKALQPKKSQRKRKRKKKKDKFDKEKYLKLKDNFDIDLGDYYGLLGLNDVGWDATEEHIKTAYKGISLFCHPDKADPKNREKAEQRFKAMQKGYETLLDATKRRLYESSVAFDDYVPDDDEGNDEEFYEVYGPVFQNFAKFSSVKPVPQLGDANTDIDTIHKFYDFWLYFKSWRDFSFLADHKLSDQMGRDEKRFMMKENQKKTQVHKKQETANIRKLVEDAMRKDPRMIQHREEVEEQKLALKNAKKEKKKERTRRERQKITRREGTTRTGKKEKRRGSRTGKTKKKEGKRYTEKIKNEVSQSGALWSRRIL